MQFITWRISVDLTLWSWNQFSQRLITCCRLNYIQYWMSLFLSGLFFYLNSLSNYKLFPELSTACQTPRLNKFIDLPWRGHVWTTLLFPWIPSPQEDHAMWWKITVCGIIQNYLYIRSQTSLFIELKVLIMPSTTSSTCRSHMWTIVTLTNEAPLTERGHWWQLTTNSVLFSVFSPQNSDDAVCDVCGNTTNLVAAEILNPI